MKTTSKTVQTVKSMAAKLVFSLAVCAFVGLMGTSALAKSSGKTRPTHSVAENFATPTAFGETFVARGNATHQGKIVRYGTNYFLGFNADGLFHGVGSSRTVGANGDETWVIFEWTLDVFAPMEDWVVNVTWVIVGGTGRLENATGEGTGVGRLNADGNLVFIDNGVITY